MTRAGVRLPDQNHSQSNQKHVLARSATGKRQANLNGVLGTHLKRQIMGREVVVAVTNSRLDGFGWRSTEGFDRAQPRASRRGLAELFGTWEQFSKAWRKMEQINDGH